MEISNSTNISADIISAEERDVISWSVHLVRREPRRLMPIVGAACFTCSAAWLVFYNPIFCLAGLFMIASATSEYWLPIQFRLTDRAAYSRFGANRLEITWPSVRRVLLYSDGVRLSPLVSPSRLDPFRGVFLRFAQDGQPGDKASVISAIEQLRSATCGEEAG